MNLCVSEYVVYIRNNYVYYKMKITKNQKEIKEEKKSEILLQIYIFKYVIKNDSTMLINSVNFDQQSLFPELTQSLNF
jgi:hypothetical protein